MLERNILLTSSFLGNGASKYVGSFEISRVKFVLNSVQGLIIFGPNEEAMDVVNGKNEGYVLPVFLVQRFSSHVLIQLHGVPK